MDWEVWSLRLITLSLFSSSTFHPSFCLFISPLQLVKEIQDTSLFTDV